MFPSLTREEKSFIASDGKIPVHSRWEKKISDGKIAPDTLLTLAGLARHDEALAAAEPALLMSGRDPRILAEVAAVHAARGDRTAAEAVHQEIQSRARTGYIGWAEQAAIAASAGIWRRPPRWCGRRSRRATSS